MNLKVINTTNLKNFFNAHWQILVILVLATGMRFYHWFDIPYMHDELSALIRTKFNSYREVLEKGIKVDGHPALIQSFLYFWTKWFGYAEWIVKLPFLLMSVGSVYLIYRIGTKWFNPTAGLLLAAFFTCSEYALMYGQIIRPYGSGLFFTLLLTYHWGELVFFNNFKKRHILFYILGATLCSYNHHFSLLIAGLIGVFGIFFISGNSRKKYVLLSLCIPLLYLPHLSIFLYQLSIGGVEGWLGKPSPDFILNYLDYVFHFSWIVILGSASILILAAVIKRQERIKVNRFQVFSLLLFFTNYTIAYFYSVYGTSVLQSSVLIFSFPFLLLFLVGFTQNQPPRTNSVLIGLLLLVIGYSLIAERKYYHVFYVATFKQLVLDADEFNQMHPAKTLFFSDVPKTQFYEPEISISNDYLFVHIPGFTLYQLDSLLKESTKSDDYFCLAATSSFPPHYRALIQSYYPVEVKTHNYFSASTVLFAKGTKEKNTLTSFSLKSIKAWQGVDPLKWKNNAYQFNEGDEWGPSFGREIPLFLRSEYDVFDVEATIKLSDPNQEILLVINGQEQDSTFLFRASSTKDFIWNKNDSTITLVQSVKFIDTPFQRFKQPKINTFLWNRDKKAFRLLRFEVFYRDGNPLTYALYNKVN